MFSKKIIGVVVSILVLIILFFPSVYTKWVVKYDDSRMGYGEATHFDWRRGLLYGVDYDGDMYFLYFRNGWKYEKFLSAPESSDFEWNSVYLSDSVAYVGSYNGWIYYADPDTGNIIDIVDLSELHIYFNATNKSNVFYCYSILWGNKSGYFYILFNNTIYHIYRDARIIDSYHYNFSGFFVSAHRWNGGFILKFGEKPKPWLHASYRYNVYYVKDGKIIWNLTFPSSMYRWQSDAPDVYIYQNYVYHFNNSKITVFRDGNEVKSFYVNGSVVSLQRRGGELFVYTYNDTKNNLLVYDDNYRLVKSVMLFDMKEIGVKRYSITNQKVSMYENSSGFAVFLYTSSSIGDDHSPYLPLRIVYLDKNLNVVWRHWFGNIYIAGVIYPLWSRGEFALVDYEYSNLYFVSFEKRTFVDPFAFMYTKSLILIFMLLTIGYIYVKKMEAKMRMKKFKNS